jgi:hypothetical protein
LSAAALRGFAAYPLNRSLRYLHTPPRDLYSAKIKDIAIISDKLRMGKGDFVFADLKSLMLAKEKADPCSYARSHSALLGRRANASQTETIAQAAPKSQE